jgi:hypothetical protein
MKITTTSGIKGLTKAFDFTSTFDDFEVKSSSVNYTGIG